MLVNSIEYDIKSFDVLTDLSFNFIKLDNGHYGVRSRGTDTDLYQSRIHLYDDKNTLDGLMDYIYGLRGLGSTVFNVSFDSDNERIFGADIDYTSISDVVYVKDSIITEETLDGYKLSLILQSGAVSFQGTAELPDLKYSDLKYNAGSELTRQIDFIYNTASKVQDKFSDYGTFTSVFYFNNSEMANLRRFYATKRGASFYLDEIDGLDYIFGKKRAVIWPAHVRLIDISEKYIGPNRWACEITLVEEV